MKTCTFCKKNSLDIYCTIFVR